MNTRRVTKPNAKLTDAQVREIKLHMLDGVTSASLARLYGVSGETINRIRRGLTHQNVVVVGEESLRDDAPLAAIPPAPHAPDAPAEPQADESLRRLADILDQGLEPKEE